ncbi:mRNA-decapping enzyme 1A-like [Branchiostoma floridae]|uniref:5'-(N(7)-methylguanosine 5'-triphospho)-[mRNA] hydrolase n=1 Tax=Branchiostoma floridae TaxID=7739 RepID=A0A9J7MRG3_BRAFL|nr:mRNA-decapping enzyme 1A-like [Branchiostoma floridae]
MASSAESQMNLAALQQRDPYITNIIDTASQVALYTFSAKKNEWEKTDIEGALFVYTRSAAPHNGFTIVNRLSMNNLTEPITKDLEFQLQDPFLLYRNAQHQIYGIWFYDKDECARVGQHMNSLTQWAASSAMSEHSPRRQRRASLDGATPIEGSVTVTAGKREVDIIQMLSKAQDEYDKQPDSDTGTTEKRVDILQLLSKAQGDYHKSKQTSGAEPKPMIDNLTSRAEGGTGGLVRPVALKPEPAASQAQVPAPQPRPVNLATLFNQPVDQRPVQVSEHHPAAAPGQQHATAANNNNKMPVLLQRLMSNPGIGERVTTLESLEADQLGPRGGEAGAAGGGEPQFQPDQLVEQLNMLKMKQQEPVCEEAGDVPTSPGTNLLKMLQASPASFTGTATSTTVDSGNLLLKNLQAMSPQPSSLLTPQAFEAAAAASAQLPQSGPRRTRMSSTSSTTSLDTAASQFKIHPLSKEQLKQGLLYLIENDDDFVNKIHDGYLQSLKARRDSNL